MEHDEIYDKDGAILKAGGLILDENKRVLLYKGEHTSYSFPKGHLEEAEDTEDCAIREIFEETGLNVVIQKKLANLEYFNAFMEKNVRVVMFLMKPISGKLTPEFEGDELIWLTYEQALEKLDPKSEGQFVNLWEYLAGVSSEFK